MNRTLLPSRRILCAIVTPLVLLGCSAANVDAAQSDAAAKTASERGPVIAPGDSRFDTPEFDDFEATYTSQSATQGAFTLQARKTGNGKKLALVDIIPMDDAVIVSQRQIDLSTHGVEYGAGPYFAWGQDFVVRQQSADQYSWTRVPIGGGEPIAMTGTMSGTVDDMFSPTLASLMPMPTGARFQLPQAYARKGGFVSAELDAYRVLRREQITLASGQSCNCWVLERTSWGGGVEHSWISRSAPFVIRRVRGVGTSREFTSEVLSYRVLQ